MNIRKYRSSFLVYTIDSNESRRRFISDVLSSLDYRVDKHESLQGALAALPNSPPHFIIIDGGLLSYDRLREFLDFCPETHVIAICHRGEEQEFFSMLTKGLYDVLSWPLIDSAQLVGAIDRGAERDYFQYKNEQLIAKLQVLKGQLADENRDPNAKEQPRAEQLATQNIQGTQPLETRVSVQLQSLGELMKKMSAAGTMQEGIELLLENAYAWFGQPVIFFKYLPARRSLFLNLASGLVAEKYRGVGIDFSLGQMDFTSAQLKTPADIPAFREMLASALNIKEFLSYPLIEDGGVKGIIVVAKQDLGIDEVPFRLMLNYVWSHCLQLALRGRIHSLETSDPTTQVWNQRSFDSRLREELSRSRRTKLPVSLIRIGIDRFGEIKKTADSESIGLLLRAVAGIVRKTSRINDIVGRLSEDELGLVLPHTGSRGAAIKAERLRRMVESADFSKVLGGKKAVTVSVGVSEYPSFCHDADELYQSADNALFQVKEAGANRVCLASVPDGFVADFEVGPT
ncbi:MAG: GGDEF domain-containing response regulator [Bdellovibrionales bacterium]|nr:GGDEF domain-containing response regulator [Bdellovibrionales bacterium]